jgi:hypothetical protein
MYELLFVQGQTFKNRGWSTRIANGEDHDQLIEVMRKDLKTKGIVAPYFRTITKEDATVIDYGSYTSKYIIKKV